MNHAPERCKLTGDNEDGGYDQDDLVGYPPSHDGERDIGWEPEKDDHQPFEYVEPSRSVRVDQFAEPEDRTNGNNCRLKPSQEDG